MSESGVKECGGVLINCRCFSLAGFFSAGCVTRIAIFYTFIVYTVYFFVVTWMYVLRDTYTNYKFQNKTAD